MKYSDAFPSQYLKKDDIPGVGALFNIESVKMEKFTDPDTQVVEEKPVITFSNTEKKLILNKTNWKSIAALHGDDTKGWNSKDIVLYLAEEKSFGKMVDCIRVKG